MNELKLENIGLSILPNNAILTVRYKDTPYIFTVEKDFDDERYYDIWIQHEKYGVKAMVIGFMGALDEFLAYIMNVAEDSISLYQKEYED